MTVNLNQVAMTGNLTRDPVLLELPSGHIVCEMSVACHRRSRDEITGEWREWADYFTVKAFGFQARTTHQRLCKGQGVALSGRLSSRRVPGADGKTASVVEIVAEVVQFLSPPRGR